MLVTERSYGCVASIQPPITQEETWGKVNLLFVKRLDRSANAIRCVRYLHALLGRLARKDPSLVGVRRSGVDGDTRSG